MVALAALHHELLVIVFIITFIHCHPQTVSGAMRLVDTRFAHEFGESLVLVDTEVRRGSVGAEEVIPPGSTYSILSNENSTFDIEY